MNGEDNGKADLTWFNHNHTGLTYNLHTARHLIKQLNEVSQRAWNGAGLRTAINYFFVISETCSNEPTQQGALPLHGERRGTLTARP